MTIGTGGDKAHFWKLNIEVSISIPDFCEIKQDWQHCIYAFFSFSGIWVKALFLIILLIGLSFMG